MTDETPAIPAVGYLRAAPGESPGEERQRQILQTFAAAHSMRLTGCFADVLPPEAPGGPAPPHQLRALLERAEQPEPGFEFVLVLDAARLAREHPFDWQGADAALRAAGTPPLYVEEPWRNDGAAIGRRIRRLMEEERLAGHGARIAAGHRRWAAQGFHIAGKAPFGYRRQQIGWNQEGRTLELGEGRPCGRYRSVLVPGPQDEQHTVLRIFTLYARHGLSGQAIAERLTSEGVWAGKRGPWAATTILNMLKNEAYLGVRIHGRRGSSRRRDAEGRRRPLGDAEPVRIEAAHRPLVTPELFQAARERMAGKRRRFTDEEIREGLRRLLRAHGVITCAMIDDDPELPCVGAVGKRFGGLQRAYAAIGYDAPDAWGKRRMGGALTLAGAGKVSC